MTEAVLEAFDQCVRARKHLLSKPDPEIVVDNRLYAIDMAQVSAVYITNVTLTQLQMHATRLANCNAALGLFSSDEYLWSMALGDLDILTQLLGSPARFLHYVAWRLQLEHTGVDICGDEMDLLGFYLNHSMPFNPSKVGFCIVGASAEVDRWVFERYQLGKAVEPPFPTGPDGFNEFIAEIERSRSMHRTNCALALLDLCERERSEFMAAVSIVKQRTIEDQQSHSFCMILADGNAGLSFISLGARDDGGNLFDRTANFARRKKYEQRASAWFGFGWTSESRRSVDAVFFASFIWVSDEGANL